MCALVMKRPRMGEWWKRFRGKAGETELERPKAIDRMKALFEKEKIPYRVIYHSEVYTSPELAASIHTPGRRVAKTVIVHTGGEYVMAVVPSHRQLDLDLLAQTIGVRRVALAREWEIESLFLDCEIGAMPPLGNLYGLRVYLDKSLAEEPIIYFQAGSHDAVIRMQYLDFERLVHPEVGHFVTEPLETAIGF